jgi:hypothetical protein
MRGTRDVLAMRHREQLAQDAIPGRLMPALDSAPCRRMRGRAANVPPHASGGEPGGEVAGDVAGAVVGSGRGRCRTRAPLRPAAAGASSGVSVTPRATIVVQSFRGDDEARGVVERGGGVGPASAGDREVGEVGPPELIGRGGSGVELVGRLGHDEDRAGDEVVRREQAVGRGLKDKVAPAAGRAHGEPARRSLGLRQREVDDAAAHRVGDAVPVAVGPTYR